MTRTTRINPADNFKGDFIAYLDRIADLKNAAAPAPRASCS